MRRHVFALRRAVLLLAATLCLAACGSVTHTAPAARPDLAALAQEVRDTETAFARTMADRDHAAFVRFLAEDTVWFSGGEAPLRGKAAVAAHWKRFYEQAQAPFSWRPDAVDVLASGGLAMSSGPVMDPSGKPVARFVSVWRREAPGVWRVVFDRGCNCP